MKFSIVLPVFNGEQFLDECLLSLSVLGTNIAEILVINDASTDNTAAILADWEFKLPHLKVITSRTNHGVSYSRNLGIQAALSDWLIFTDADDCLSAHYCDAVSEAVSENADSCLVFGNYQQINEDGQPIGNPISNAVTDMGAQKGQLLVRNYITSTSGVAVKREHIGTGFNEALTLAEDWELWLRMADKGLFIHLDETLVKLRRHRYNASRDVSQMQQAVRDVLQGLGKDEIEEAVYARDLPAAQNLADLVSIYQTMEDWIQVQCLLTNGIKQYSDSADLQFYLGILHCHQKNYSEAMKAFELCISMSPHHLAGRQNLAVCYLARKMVTEGINELTKVLDENPDYMDAQFNLSRCEQGIAFDSTYKITTKPLRSTLIKYQIS